MERRSTAHAGLSVLICAHAVCLIKPQFEAGKDKVGKKGVVREKSVHLEVVQKVISLCLENGFSPLGLQFSPIKGPEGNIEYLIYIEKSENPVVSDCVNPSRKNSINDI